MRIHFRLRRLKEPARHILEPQLEWQGIEAMVESPACGNADHAMDYSLQRVLPLDSDRHAVKRHTEVFAHRLHFPVFPVTEPGQHRVPGKEVCPALECFGNVNAQL